MCKNNDGRAIVGVFVLISDIIPTCYRFYVVPISKKHLNVDLFSCSHKALSQMPTTTSVVWQTEDADPLLPIQVIIIHLFVCLRGDTQCARHLSPNNSFQMKPDVWTRVWLVLSHCAWLHFAAVHVLLLMHGNVSKPWRFCDHHYVKISHLRIFH